MKDSIQLQEKWGNERPLLLSSLSLSILSKLNNRPGDQDHPEPFLRIKGQGLMNTCLPHRISVVSHLDVEGGTAGSVVTTVYPR